MKKQINKDKISHTPKKGNNKKKKYIHNTELLHLPSSFEPPN
jgi:hypothetical protein